MNTTRSLAACLLLPAIISCGTGKKLEAANQALEEQSRTNTRIMQENSKMKEENSKMKSELNAYASATEEAKRLFGQYRAECERTQAKLNVSQAILRDEYTSLQNLEERLQAALINFMSWGVQVYEKDGLVYVSLSDGLLYKTGSAKLDEKGVAALGALAGALNDYPDLKVVVVGNTDDQAFKKGSDNWTLSTDRANTVVRVLRDQYKLNPARLTAAGRSKYSPVADNSTADGRAKNRRTDIILNPDLAKLWETVKNEKR